MFIPSRIQDNIINTLIGFNWFDLEAFKNPEWQILIEKVKSFEFSYYHVICVWTTNHLLAGVTICPSFYSNPMPYQRKMFMVTTRN